MVARFLLIEIMRTADFNSSPSPKFVGVSTEWCMQFAGALKTITDWRLRLRLRRGWRI